MTDHILCLLLLQAVFIELHASDLRTVHGYLGGNATLPSGANPTWTLSSIEWSIFKNFTWIATYRNGDENIDRVDRYKGRLSLDIPTGDLTIHGLTKEDNMVYTIDFVNTEGYGNSTRIKLQVNQRPQKPTIQAVPSTLANDSCWFLMKCSSADEGVDVSWQVASSSATVYNKINTDRNSAEMLVFLNTTQTAVTVTCTSSGRMGNSSSVITPKCDDLKPKLSPNRRNHYILLFFAGIIVTVIPTLMCLVELAPRMQAVRVKYRDHQKYIGYEGQLTFDSFLRRVAEKFDLPTPDLKVFDETKTEVDRDAFEFLLKKQDLGVLEVCLPQYCSHDSGPKAHRDPFREEKWLTSESLCCEAIALMKDAADKAIVKENMKQTFPYRQRMIHDPVKSSEIFTVFPRFLDIPGMVEQDFSLMFGEATSAKFLEKWPTVYKQKVLDQSRGLTQTAELQDLVQTAESTTGVENGWDSDMSSILILIHLLPPSPHGSRSPGKLSARPASDHLVKFIKAETSIQDHLDSITENLQPYLLAVGPQKKEINKYFIVIDKHAIPCQSADSLAAIDELFKAHFVFGTSYNQDLINVFNFVQTSIYEIDVGSTKVNPRVAELRAQFLH
ncbi:uncharacterized protein si:cabz01074946.1 isoform X1 [Cheilinus undulatus]|uniref:uncharacterized protein si:cabz01074946.1 isoform X1 n=1 Tax=Cheilinus undulatus TaxID=241271 RepID=UPI001BD49404|nr:uncharacterized protein si:cabz01074946.1 isoform X1 [Cheilinus undulatus]